jgi:hypothetical protein
MVRVTIDSHSQRELTDWAVKYLEDMGYSIAASQPTPETPQQLSARLHLSRRHVLRRLAHPGCPKVRFIRSKAERISLVFATPELDEFLKRRLRDRSD